MSANDRHAPSNECFGTPSRHTASLARPLPLSGSVRLPGTPTVPNVSTIPVLPAPALKGANGAHRLGRQPFAFVGSADETRP